MGCYHLCDQGCPRPRRLQNVGLAGSAHHEDRSVHQTPNRPCFAGHRHCIYPFQEKNTRPHTAGLTTHFLQQNNVRLTIWPSPSPDGCCLERNSWGCVTCVIRRALGINSHMARSSSECWTGGVSAQRHVDQSADETPNRPCFARHGHYRHSLGAHPGPYVHRKW